MKIETKEYFDIEKRQAVKDSIRKVRRQFLRYKEAEIVYSIQHKKLLELAGLAGALYRIDGYVLINRDIFDPWLEQFREPATDPENAASVLRREAEHERNDMDVLGSD